MCALPILRHSTSATFTGRCSRIARVAATATRTASNPSRAVQALSSSPRATRRNARSSSRYASANRSGKAFHAGPARGVETALEAELESNARGLDLVDQALRLGKVHCQRLLAEDRDATLESGA